MSTSGGGGGSGDFALLDRLAEEFAARFRRGERPSLKEYTDRYPDLASEIEQLFPALVDLERAEEALDAPAVTGEFVRTSPQPMKQVGDYRILREVGRGGMGVVYEAEQVSLGRRVALKILPQQVARDRKMIERFRREARAAARLHHTNIVPVFEVGRDGDTVYYAMQFIQGQGLDLVIDELRRVRSHAPGLVDPRTTGSRAVPPGGTLESEPAASPPDRDASEVLRDPARVRAVSQVAHSLLAGRFDPEVDPTVAREANGEHSTRALELSPSPEAATEAAERGTASEDRTDYRIPTEAGRSGRAAPSQGASESRLSASGSSSAVLPGGTQISGVTSAAGRKDRFHRGIAQIGRQAAQGLAYAHARGIIHRDIKPSNLLLDTAGVVWITDFGLAKAEDDGLTQTGDILGTIRYMAPERFRGEGDGRADVYALGLTLYELLTLKPAYESADRLRLIERIKNEEPVRPRAIDRRIPRDLETIVLKAVEKDPKRRYASADAMAEDLRRYLDDEPIEARQASAAERYARWARRNPAIAFLGAVLTAVLVLTTVASWMVAGRMARLADDQRLAAEDARQAADAERTAKLAAIDAEKQARSAEKLAEERRREALANLEQANEQRKRAERSDSLARQAVNDFFVQISENKLLDVPNLQPLRVELLSLAQNFYQNFLKQHADDPTLARELLSTRLRNGKLLNTIGRDEESAKAIEDARRRYEAALQEHPDDPDLKMGLAEALMAGGAGTLDDGTLTMYQRVIRLRDEVRKARPSDFENRKELAQVHNNYAVVAGQKKRDAEVLEHVREAIQLRLELASERPDDPEVLVGLFQSFNNVVKPSEAPPDQQVVLYRRAMEFGKAALRLRPNDLNMASGFPRVTQNLVKVLWNLDRKDEGVVELEKSSEILRRMSERNPLVPTIQSQYISILETLANWNENLNRYEGAAQAWRRMLPVFERYPQATGEDLFTVARLQTLVSQRLERILKRGRDKLSDTAEVEVETLRAQGIALLERAASVGWDKADATRKDDVFRLVAERADFKKAVAAIEQAAKDKAAGKPHTSAGTGVSLAAGESAGTLKASILASRAMMAQAIGRSLLAAGKTAEGNESLKSALEFHEQAVRENPLDRETRAEQIGALAAIGKLYWDSDRLAEAHALFKPARELLTDLLGEGEPVTDVSSAVLAQAIHDMGLSLGLAGLWLDSAQVYELAVALKLPDKIATDHLFDAAVMRLRGGDVAGYQRLVGTIRTRFENSTDPHVVNMLNWICALDARSGVEPGWVVGRARLALENMAEPWMAMWNHYLLALALHRAGEHAEAVEVARKSLELTDRVNVTEYELSDAHSEYYMPDYHAVLALCLYGLGQAEAAREVLEQGETGAARMRVVCMRAGDPYIQPFYDEGLLHGTWEGWHNWPIAELLLDEAKRRIDGKPSTCMIEDRVSLGLLQHRLENATAGNATLRSVASEQHGDLGVTLALMRSYLMLGQEAPAREKLGEALNMPRGEALEPWVATGRLLMERGWREESRAVYTKASAGMSDPLQPFLMVGWWTGRVIGDTDASEKEIDAIEHFDPSQTMKIAGQATQRWKTVLPHKPSGKITLDKEYPGRNGEVDLVTIVQVTKRRSAILKLRSAHTARVIVNGKEVYQSPSSSVTISNQVPILLELGSNVIRIRTRRVATAADWTISVELAEAPEAIAEAYRSLFLWDEAITATDWKPEDLRLSNDGMVWYRRIMDLSMVGRGAESDRLYQRMRQAFQHGKPENWQMALVFASSGPPEPDPFGATLVPAARKSLEIGPEESWRVFWVGYAYYLAGQFEEAEKWLRRSHKIDSQNPLVLSTLAVVLRLRGKTDEAKACLDRTESWLNIKLQQMVDRGQTGIGHWDMSVILRLREEASRSIEGQPRPPLAKLLELQARHRAMLGPVDQPAHLFTLVELQGQEGTMRRLLWSQELARKRRWGEAEAEVRRRAALEADPARVWINWGQILASLGESERADAAYARAAELVPDELNRFLEGGWSLVSRPQAPGDKPNAPAWTPSQRDILTGSLVEPTWDGRVRQSQLGGDGIKYALAHIHAPEDRTAILLLGGEGKPTVWLNGRTIATEFTRDGAWYLDVSRIPIALRRGSNTLVLRMEEKVKRDPIVRLADLAGTRAEDLAHLGQREAALEAYERHFSRGFDQEWWRWLFRGYLLAHARDDAGYRQHAERVFAHFGPVPANVDLDIALAILLAIAPGEPDRGHLRELLGKIGDDPVSTLPDQRVSLIWANVRAGELDRAGAILKRIPEAEQERDSRNWPVLAQYHRARGESAQARLWLERAERWNREQARAVAEDPTWRMSESWDVLYWREIVLAQAREAIQDEPPGPDGQPMFQALCAKGKRAIEQLDPEAHAFEFAELLEPDNPTLAFGYARWLAEEGKLDEAEVYIARRAARDKNPQLAWIRWGRILAGRSENARADAAYARAAELAPDRPSEFLKAGWWVVGPYASVLSEPIAVESAPDPARLAPDGFDRGFSHWTERGNDGSLYCDLGPAAPGNQGSAYALTHVYSASNRTALLFHDLQQRSRIWINGDLVFDFEANTTPGRSGLDRVIPVTLGKGRNTVLVKVAHEAGQLGFRLRFDDFRPDRAWLLAMFGAWEEAARLYDEAYAAGEVSGGWTRARAVDLSVARDDRAAYLRWLGRLLTSASPDPRDLATALALMPNDVRPAEDVIKMAEAVAPAPPITRDTVWKLAQISLALWHADRPQALLDHIEANWPDGGESWEFCLQAMAHQRLGHEQQARAFLARADADYDELLAARRDGREPSWGWEVMNPTGDFFHLRREAHALIDGHPPADSKLAQVQDGLVRNLDLAHRASPTWAYDIAVALDPKVGVHYVERARRMFALGRPAEAEKDLARAVEAEPENPDLWFARARIFLERCETARAVADVGKGLDLIPRNLEVFNRRGLVLYDFAQYEPFFAELAKSRPDDLLVHYIRGAALAARRRWGEAAAAYRAGGEPPPTTEHAFIYAGLLLLQGDQAAYGRYTGRLAREASDAGDERYQFDSSAKYIVARALGLARSSGVAPEVHLGLAQGCLEGVPRRGWLVHVLALAQLRTGDPSSAYQSLEETRTLGWCTWLNDLARAVALEQLGQQPEARAELGQVGRHQLIRVMLRPGGNTSMALPDWIESQVLGREAEQEILDDGFPDNPFAQPHATAPAP